MSESGPSSEHTETQDGEFPFSAAGMLKAILLNPTTGKNTVSPPTLPDESIPDTEPEP